MTIIFFISLTGVVGVLTIRWLELRRGADFAPGFQRGLERRAGKVYSDFIRVVVGLVKNVPKIFSGAKKIVGYFFKALAGLFKKVKAQKKFANTGDKQDASSSAFLRQVATYRRDR